MQDGADMRDVGYPGSAALSGGAGEMAIEASRSFDHLPLIHEGESKILRDFGDGRLAIRLKPTVYSFTANRYATITGTSAVRLRCCAILWGVLRRAGIETAVLEWCDDCYVARRVVAPPIEVVVKAALVGTPKHLYKRMSQTTTRHGDLLAPDQRHSPYVRFDWRNPLPDKDECMPTWLADRFIDTEAAAHTALAAFDALAAFLHRREIDLLDICFFIDESGRCVFGEVSPDCMRCKHRGVDLDKDLWRKGRASREVLDGWQQFLKMIS